MTPAFLLTTLLVVLAPGSGAIYTLSAGLSRGRRAGVIAAAGCTLGIIPHVLATVLGVAALLHASATAFQVLKWLGVAYLLFLAWQTLRDRGDLLADVDRPQPSHRQVIGSAILINLLNPKLTIFFLAFLPQFVPVHGAAQQMLWLSVVFMAMTFAVFAAYGIGAAAVRRQLQARPRIMQWISRVFAASFVALGVRLAISDA